MRIEKGCAGREYFPAGTANFYGFTVCACFA